MKEVLQYCKSHKFAKILQIESHYKSALKKIQELDKRCSLPMFLGVLIPIDDDDQVNPE